jgi:hypothetical protein
MSTYRLNEKLREERKKVRSGQNPVLLGARKNLGVVVPVLNEHIRDGDKNVTTAELAVELRGMGLDSYWNLDPNAKDNSGLQKALGDLLGGHGLNLEKGRFTRNGKQQNGYRLPGTLIGDAFLISKNINPKSENCQSPPELVELVEPEPATAEPEPAPAAVFAWEQDDAAVVEEAVEAVVTVESQPAPAEPRAVEEAVETADDDEASAVAPEAAEEAEPGPADLEPLEALEAEAEAHAAREAARPVQEDPAVHWDEKAVEEATRVAERSGPVPDSEYERRAGESAALDRAEALDDARAFAAWKAERAARAKANGHAGAVA